MDEANESFVTIPEVPTSQASESIKQLSSFIYDNFSYNLNKTISNLSYFKIMIVLFLKLCIFNQRKFNFINWTKLL